jgi:hypothetical protein
MTVVCRSSRAGTGSGHSDGRNRTVTLQKRFHGVGQFTMGSRAKEGACPAAQERSHGRD